MWIRAWCLSFILSFLTAAAGRPRLRHDSRAVTTQSSWTLLQKAMTRQFSSANQIQAEWGTPQVADGDDDTWDFREILSARLCLAAGFFASVALLVSAARTLRDQKWRLGEGAASERLSFSRKSSVCKWAHTADTSVSRKSSVCDGDLSWCTPPETAETPDNAYLIGLCEPPAATRRVRFDTNTVSKYEIAPYSEIYGVHPRQFVFDRDGVMIAAAFGGAISLADWQERAMTALGMSSTTNVAGGDDEDEN